MLGNVDVINNKIFSKSTISTVFDGMLTRPVTSQQVEQNLYLINDYAGLSVSGYFEAGNQVGDTKFNINVNSEEKYSSNIRLDNHGTKETGLYRVFANFQVNNLLGIADSLNLSVLSATAPNNTNYWKIDYQTKVFSPRIFIKLGNSTNQFVVDQQNTGFNLNGIVTTNDISAVYKFNRSRINNDTFELKYQTVSSDLQLGDLPDIGNALDEKVNLTSLIYKFDFLQEKQRRLHQGSIVFTAGEYDFGNSLEVGDKFEYLTADYTLLTFFNIPFTESTARLIVRVGGQYAGEFLSSIAKYSLSGASRARAYSPDVFSADDALFASVDLVFNSPDMFDFNLFGETQFKDIAKPFIFIDYGYGVQQPISSAEERVNATLVDAGLGLKFSYLDKVQGNLHIAFPVTNEFSDPEIIIKENDVRFVLDFQYKF